MSVKQVFAADSSFALLGPLIDKAEARLSFWGTRYVSLTKDNNDVDFLPIDALAAQVIDLAEKKGFIYDDTERTWAISIARKIDQIYEQSDVQVRTSNFITWLCASAKDTFNCYSSSNTLPNYVTSSETRWKWLDCESANYSGYHQVFHFFTYQQYQLRFNTIPGGNSWKFNTSESRKKLDLWRPKINP